MSDVGQIEHLTQKRVLRLLGQRFGYRSLGNWQAVREELGKYEVRTDEIFEIVKNQREY